MPLYDYECGRCAHKFEMRKSFTEGAEAECPQCNSQAKRVFVPVPIVFKGSGFYVTDYRKEKAPVEAPAKTETKSPCAAAGKTDCSTPGSCCSTPGGCSKN
jgi:putative FmdB family regulatory protein